MDAVTSSVERRDAISSVVSMYVFLQKTEDSLKTEYNQWALCSGLQTLY